GVRDEVLGLAGPGVGGAVRGRPAEHHVVAAQDVQHGQLGLLAARLPAVPGRGRRPAARPQCAQLAAGQGVLGRLLAAGDGAFVRARVVEGLGAAARDGGEVALCPRLPGEPRIVRGGREREQALVTGFVVAGYVVTALVVRAACTLVLVVGVQRYPADDDGVDATALGGTLGDDAAHRVTVEHDRVEPWAQGAVPQMLDDLVHSVSTGVGVEGGTVRMVARAVAEPVEVHRGEAVLGGVLDVGVGLRTVGPVPVAVVVAATAPQNLHRCARSQRTAV